MTANSILGYRAPDAPDASLADRAGDDLERSCGSPVTDRIRIAEGTGIERIEAAFRGNAFAPHRHDTYALGLTLHGVQTFRYRGEVRYSAPGNIIVLHPDEVHDGGAATEDGLRYRMLYLPPERLIDALGSRDLPFVASPVLSDPSLAASLADAMRDLDGELDDLHCAELLSAVADGLSRHARRGTAAGVRIDAAAVRRACDFLHGAHDRPVTSADLEAVTGLDRFALARQFRACLGTSPHRYLIMRRLEQARALIRKGRPLADIALATGFADQAHFTRHFKTAHGLTPGRWAALSRG
ncbi:AraC family transcriptional regulator [Rhizobium sp. Leaf371]|uniref:AraC family transcriptional regulator n=1 Tax=Rhizobium sp. Leaf371 TaxID=1736355 RepID=UPI001FCCE8B3|nr:AraC family transcriptional regulator [Rhizobium sp. Leaf371]